MMMALDVFIFEIGTLPYQQLARATEWRFAENERFRAPNAVQFLGPGADKITLTASLFPGLVGRYSAIDTLRAMAATGEAWLLMDGLGNLMGDWNIISLSDTRTTFFVDGVARKADVAIELKWSGYD
jgi:phage protein U